MTPSRSPNCEDSRRPRKKWDELHLKALDNIKTKKQKQEKNMFKKIVAESKICTFSPFIS